MVNKVIDKIILRKFRLNEQNQEIIIEIYFEVDAFWYVVYYDNDRFHIKIVDELTVLDSIKIDEFNVANYYNVYYTDYIVKDFGPILNVKALKKGYFEFLLVIRFNNFEINILEEDEGLEMIVKKI